MKVVILTTYLEFNQDQFAAIYLRKQVNSIIFIILAVLVALTLKNVLYFYILEK